jgi:glyoxylase-like metal-dependent hydrolase (beta-lactamase superfamily II)
MIFSLEALQADEGDCLLLHYGDVSKPKRILIDGGPSGIYNRSLRPRLAELAAGAGPAPVPLELVIVSHIDADHIAGVLDLFTACARAAEDDTEPPADPKRLWHNAFGPLTGLDPTNGAPAAVEPIGSASPTTVAASIAVAASVDQGISLNDYARRVQAPINDGKGGLIEAPEAGGSKYDFGDGLSLTVIHPDRARLDALRSKFAKAAQSDGAPAALAAAYSDRSVPNLSSIVILAEFDHKRILLTGDARGDDVLDGLARAGLLDSHGGIDLDVLKVPHHGSDRNVETEFFSRVRAQHYVISGDGTDGNPENATLQMILDARGSTGYTVHLTNPDGKKDLGARLQAFLNGHATAGNPLPVSFRDNAALSLGIDLLSPAVL